MTGKLPIGLEFAGKRHQEFELRPQLVEDAVLIYEDPDHGARAEKNSYFAGVCILARRLNKLGDIPKESITPDLIMKMDAADMAAIQKTDRGQLQPKP
ncbi:MAG: hypothetical protein NTX59_08240 [Elusimicrobia bacterium]|nr:hypothetical protein [Elusimicrobiota bacterium]